MTRRILLVDDDVAIITGLAALLEWDLPDDVEVTAFSDAQAAIARIASGPCFHLVVTDWDMPQCTGAEILNAVQERDQNDGRPQGSTPVLLFSGQEREASQFTAFIPRLSDSSELSQIILRYLPPASV